MKLDPVVAVIKQEMIDKGLSPEQLADAAGVHFTSLYRIFNESDPATPNLALVNKLTKALKLKLVVGK